MTQIKIEGYGPWTLKLGSDRESQLQMLQSKLYYDLQKAFSEKDCIVYQNRHDELFAVTNGLSADEHYNIYSYISELYPKISLSMAIGRGGTPLDATFDAFNAKRANLRIHNGALLYGNKVHILRGYDQNGRYSGMVVQIMHIDIDDSTNMGTKISPYEVSMSIIRIFSRLAGEFVKKKNLTFYLGGDNFMVVATSTSLDDSKLIIEKISREMNLELNCGIGSASNARIAIAAATEALDSIRKMRKDGKIQRIIEIKCL